MFSDILSTLFEMQNGFLQVYSAPVPVTSAISHLPWDNQCSSIGLEYPTPVKALHENKSRIFKIIHSNTKIFHYFLAEFTRLAPGCVVLGNDTGHAERAIIRAARRLNIKTVLLQDGYAHDSVKSPLLLTFMKIWVKLTGGLIGRVPYGMMGCDTILCYNDFCKNIFLTKKQNSTGDILAFGYPNRLSRIKNTHKPERFAPIVYLASNFLTSVLAGSKKKEMHDRQIKEISELRAKLNAKFDKNLLIVKLHPADLLEHYIALRSVKNIQIVITADLHALIDESLFCVANFSSVVIDCIRAGKLCLVGAVNLNKGAFMILMQEIPGIKFFTWEDFEIYAEMIDLGRLEDLLIKQSVSSEKWLGKSDSGYAKISSFLNKYSKVN
ncbi:hypothetical protein OAH90_02740 [Alphaproteobacteria bacterium]|nr:hypothetical protein [Alphaproteobacteria bacterium]